MLNKILKAEVLGSQMAMRVRLETGEVLELAGSAPAGSELAIMATGVSRDGLLMGYEGYRVTFRPKPDFTATADACGFEEVLLVTA